jgi:hypothetical protein
MPDPLSESYELKFREGEAAERERVLVILKLCKSRPAFATFHIASGSDVDDVKVLLGKFDRPRLATGA